MTTIERIGSIPGPLLITCYAPGCGHAVLLGRETAIRRLGGWRQPYCARVALRCTVCGTKGAVQFDTGPHLRPTMCNAYRLRTPIAQLAQDMAGLHLPLRFAGDAAPNLPQWEMTRPTNTLPVFKPLDPAAPAAGLEFAPMRWWLVPFFHRGPAKDWKAMCTNARVETVARAPTFREAYMRRRCLVPADGYYEWTGEKGDKTRWRFERADGDWFSFAGLWDRHEHNGVVTESFTIITTAAGPDAAPYHSRQPVLIGKADFARWLDLGADPAPLLTASPEGSLTVELSPTQ